MAEPKRSCAVCLLPPAPKAPPHPKFHFLEKAKGRSRGLREPVGDEVAENGDRRSDHARRLETEQSGVVSWESEEGSQQAQVTSGRIWWKK